MKENKRYIGIRTKLYVLIILSLLIPACVHSVSYILQQKTLSSYQAALDSQITLNDFFVSNRSIHDLFENFVLHPSSENRISYEGELGYAKERLDHMIKNFPDGIYYEKMQDLQNMLETFEVQASDVIAKIGSVPQSELLSQTQNVLYTNTLIDYTYKKYTTYQVESISAETSRLLMTMKDNNLLCNIVFAAGLLFLCIAGYLTTRKITRPLISVVSSAKELTNRHFEIPDIDVDTNDEMEILANAFNKMKNSINGYISKINRQSLLQETSLKALRNQINSHFLFNTLNLISRSAYFEGAPQTIQLIDATTDMLRYSLYKTEDAVNIQDELSFAETYIFIQRMRFVDHLSFELLVDDDLPNILVPSFIIQPLIENAIMHGTYSKPEPCRILTAILKMEHSLLILVEDNGTGVEKDVIPSLLSKDFSPPEGSRGIGLKNVRDRIRLFYNRDDIISIYSEKESFFRVEIEIQEEDFIWDTD